MPGPVFSTINKAKTNFDQIYVEKDPRRYFSYLGQLDYIIPHLAPPVFEQLIRARAATQEGPVTVLDLGSSYGVNGALMKYALGYDDLRDRYTAPALQDLPSDIMLDHDRAFYQAWPRDNNVRVIGLDVSENAVRYAESVGTVDVGLCADLETSDPNPKEAAIIATADVVVSTGCVGYVTEKTFERVMALACRNRPAWVASFVLRMFPYDRIASTLATYGLVTEKFEGATFVQRRFNDPSEMEAAVSAVEALGTDTQGFETKGVYHADLYVSRPEAEIERVPLQKLVTVINGANKPWTIGTNVLGQHGSAARRRAKSVARQHLVASVG